MKARNGLAKIEAEKSRKNLNAVSMCCKSIVCSEVIVMNLLSSINSGHFNVAMTNWMDHKKVT